MLVFLPDFISKRGNYGPGSDGFWGKKNLSFYTNHKKFSMIENKLRVDGRRWVEDGLKG